MASLLGPLAVQRVCGPSCGCEPCSQNDDVDASGAEATVQRDIMGASGFNQPLTEEQEFKGAVGTNQGHCWEPQSQDFRAASNGPQVGSLDQFISVLKGRSGQEDVTLFGHGTGREGGFFGFGGPVKADKGCDEVHFNVAGGISVETVKAKRTQLAEAGKHLKSLTLASCNTGMGGQMVQDLANALGVPVKSFNTVVSMCLQGAPGKAIRGKVALEDPVLPGVMTCGDPSALRPQVVTSPQKSQGAVVRDISLDDDPNTRVHVRDNSTLTIRPQQITDLTRSGRATARRFYAAEPARYTPKLISEMQTALGLPPSGRIDNAMLDAVAAFQDANPPLKGDGMAGPRTLSRLLRSGLATQFDQQSYTNLAEDIFDGFSPTSSIEERLAQAWGAVIPVLTEEQVTPIPAVAKHDESSEGAFSASRWTAFISTKLLQPVPLPAPTRQTLKGVVYHEARHAEQLFNMGRMLAAKKKTPQQINKLIGVVDEPAVGEEAKSRPLERDTSEFVVAEQLFEATHGAAGKRHDELEDQVVKKRKALDAALKAANGNRLDRRVVKAQKEFDVAHAQYADLADEADAFATGFEAQGTARAIEPR